MGKGLISLLWFIAVMFVLLIAFGIGQPFIWESIVHEPPPEATATFSSLLTIVIALLALGIAAFGGGTYYILSRRIQEEVAKAAERQYLGAIVRLRTHVSALWGRIYEALLSVTPSVERGLIEGFRDMAVSYGKQADLDTQRLDEKTQQDLILGAKNNYAMALALKGDPGTAKTAEDLIHYIEEKTKNYPLERRILFKETSGFVIWRLPRKPNDPFKAAKYLREARNEANEVQKQLWKKRWKQFPKGALKE